MNNFVRLSYLIDVNTPLYPGTPPITAKQIKSIGKGNTCNTSLVCMSSHSGTHIDAPRHFFNSGRAMGGYSDKDLFFKQPLILDCPKGPDEGIGIDDVKNGIGEKKPDALLIRTGFSRLRSRHASVYRSRNPYLMPQCAAWLREERSELKALGIDCISVSSYSHRDAGRQTHKILLAAGGRNGSSVLLIEDMYIPHLRKKLKGLIVIPLLNNCPDGTPCSVVGMCDD